MPTNDINILLLADTTHPTAAVNDHINAIIESSTFQWHVENPLSCKVLHKFDLSLFDAIGFHYSIRPHHRYYTSSRLYQAIKRFAGLKFQFLQDEYRQVNVTSASMIELGIDLLFTLVRPELLDQAYPDVELAKMKKVTILTGYLSNNLIGMSTTKIKDRTVDIFYRSRECDYYLGKLGQEKKIIAERMLQLAPHYNLKVDISVKEQDRVYGEEWVKRLTSARAVLGTESGASIWDFDGSIERGIKNFLIKDPTMDFDKIYEKFLKFYEGNVCYSAISPRVFEAAALRTPMIMFPGWYSGVCLPDKHYIPLNKDFSNLPEVIDKLRDDTFLQNLADSTYSDLIASNKYSPTVLAEIVEHEIRALLPDKNRLHSSIDISSHIYMYKRKWKKLNSIYMFFAEAAFIGRNFLKILLDRQLSVTKKIDELYQGAKRYLLYLKPRIFPE